MFLVIDYWLPSVDQPGPLRTRTAPPPRVSVQAAFGPEGDFLRVLVLVSVLMSVASFGKAGARGRERVESLGTVRGDMPGEIVRGACLRPDG